MKVARQWPADTVQVFTPSRWAIATRSAVVSAAVVCVSLALATLILLGLLYGSLIATNDDVCAARVTDVGSALRSVGPAELDGALLTTNAPLTAIQVVAADGRIVAHSSDAPAAPLLSGTQIGPDLHKGISGEGAAGHDARACGQIFDTAYGRYTVLAAAGTESVNATVKSAALMVIALAPLVLAETAFVNFMLVKRSLRSVDAIRSRVAEISTSDLTERVPVPDTRDEIAALAATMNEMLTRVGAGHTAQRRFVGDASHELRSPLATIISALEVVESHPHLLDHDLAVGMLLPQAHRMKTLVDDLLLLARADEHALTRRNETVDLGDLVTREVGLLHCTPPPIVQATGTILVRGDWIGLSRMVRNLLDNAARHARSCIVVSTHVRDGWAVITVSDDGPGIPEADRRRVFDRFVRLDADRSRRGGGAGLGLAIVAEIVASHDGTVTVGAGPQGGAQVTVTLPLEH